MNSYNLFLDDERDPKFAGLFFDWDFSRVEICRTFEEFVRCIISFGIPEKISFDHDLGESKSGYDCAVWLQIFLMDRKDFIMPVFNVHSMNPVGRKNIEAAIHDIHRYQLHNQTN